MCGSQLHSLKALRAVLPMPWHAFIPGTGNGAYMLHPQDLGLLDPFIGVDSFVMADPVFGPHPHAGMSAVTVLLPESPGSIVNRDSLGDHSLIHPGDLHWLQGGSGMVHEELPAQNGLATLGLQVFVNLPKTQKQAPAATFRVHAAQMGQVDMFPAQVRVVCGELAGRASPIGQHPDWHTRVNVWDVSLPAHAQIHLPVPAGHNAFFVLRSGALRVGDEVLRAQPEQSWALVYEINGQVAAVQAASEPVRGVMFTGEPLREPVFPRGPFVGNTAADISQYIARYQRGDMGQLAPTPR
jgi:redox-sensitive bicupin YhaK (pirin superfamily)